MITKTDITEEFGRPWAFLETVRGNRNIAETLRRKAGDYRWRIRAGKKDTEGTWEGGSL